MASPAPRRPNFWTLLKLPGPGIFPFALLALLWALVLGQYRRLPNSLPSRFDLRGEPLTWVPKYPAYFTLPVLGTAAFLVLGVLQVLAVRHPVVDGHLLQGRAAQQVNRLLSRYLFFVRSALMAWLIHLEFRLTQLAYGHRETLGLDSYLVAGMLVAYTAAGAWLLLRMARRWLAWQQADEAAALR